MISVLYRKKYGAEKQCHIRRWPKGHAEACLFHKTEYGDIVINEVTSKLGSRVTCNYITLYVGKKWKDREILRENKKKLKMIIITSSFAASI